VKEGPKHRWEVGHSRKKEKLAGHIYQRQGKGFKGNLFAMFWDKEQDLIPKTEI